MIFFGFVLICLYAFRLWLAGFGGVHPDEAYYWIWSFKPSWGYFDHPPMISWSIGLGRFLVEHLAPARWQAAQPLFYAQLGLRLVPYFMTSVLLPLVLARTTELVSKRPLRNLQILVLITTPLFFVGPQIVTPDAPFFLFWAWALLLLIKFVRSRGAESFPGDVTPFQSSRAIRLGILLACAAYSKYSAILIVFLLMVTGTGLLNTIMAGCVSLALFLPYIFWTASTGKAENAGIFFQFQNALGGTNALPNYKRAGDLIGSQIFFWSPLIFALALWLPLLDLRRHFARIQKSRLTGLLSVWAFVPVMFFVVTGLKRPAEANWPLVGALAATVLVLSRLRHRAFLLFIISVSNVFILILGGLILTRGPELARLVETYAPRASEQLRKPSRLDEFKDWENFHQLVSDSSAINQAPIEVESYQVLSELLFYDRIAPVAESLGARLKYWAEGSRRSQFNMWPDRLLSEFEKKKPRWILARRATLENCSLHQTLIRGIENPQSYSLFRCGF